MWRERSREAVCAVLGCTLTVMPVMSRGTVPSEEGTEQQKDPGKPVGADRPLWITLVHSLGDTAASSEAASISTPVLSVGFLSALVHCVRSPHCQSA